MFTQRDEEGYILQFFKNTKGRFLDIGAYDGQCFSTTRALALKGWSGVCVEPSPSVFPALYKQCQDKNNILTLDCAISDILGEIDFFDSNGDMISTTSKEHVTRWQKKAGVQFKKIKVKSMTMIDLLNKVGFNFDFISLDVEMTNFKILQSFPMKKLTQVKMICVEYDTAKLEIISMLIPYGFRVLHTTSENLILGR